MVSDKAPHQVQSENGSIYGKIDAMITKQKKGITKHNQQRLDFISMMLKEMRLAEGKTQNGFVDEGISRRRIQTSEYGNNMSLIKLFSLLDCYGYSLKDLDWKE